VDSAEVRSGPSENETYFYTTNLLHRGTAVEVVETRSEGWLAIRAPGGSTSLIESRFVKRIGTTANHVVVHVQPVPIYAASLRPRDGYQQSKCALEDGTQVQQKGSVVRLQDKEFLPIVPPERELRFIREKDLTKSSGEGYSSLPTQLTQQSSAGIGPANGKQSPLPISDAPSANPGQSAESLHRQAIEADRAGNLAEAISLYTQLAERTKLSHPRVYTETIRRRDYLQSQIGAKVGTPRVSLRAPSAPGETQGKNMTQQTGGSAPWNRNSDDNGVRGVLRRSEQRADHTLYRLDDPATSWPKLYVEAGPGVNLAQYEGKIVSLSGRTTYDGMLRAARMVVREAALAP
jgi:hypothetical protein